MVLTTNHTRATVRRRDEQLMSLGIEVFRVPNEEVEIGHGPVLDRINERCGSVFNLDSNGVDETGLSAGVTSAE